MSELKSCYFLHLDGPKPICTSLDKKFYDENGKITFVPSPELCGEGRCIHYKKFANAHLMSGEQRIIGIEEFFEPEEILLLDVA